MAIIVTRPSTNAALSSGMSEPLHILLVDDDRALRLAFSKALRRKGCKISEAEDGQVALAPLMDGHINGEKVDVCVLDLRMPHLDGIGVLRRTLRRSVPVVVLTGHGSVDEAVEAMRLGADNFLQKPVDADELLPVLRQAAGSSRASPTMIGSSAVMSVFQTHLTRAAASEEPVLILGETGTGKELAARALHDQSKNRDGPFVAFNAACVPKDLFESELFGHQKGAFTGAAEKREGLLAQAGGGTLFIDEVGDLPLDAQAKLLRATEERRFRPVGSDVERPFRARLCAATHQNLQMMVEQKAFRADLYYRLSVVPLHIPPLRERGSDILKITSHWLEKLSTDTRQLRLTDAAQKRMATHAFPGNVRELINLIKRAAILTSGDSIDVNDLESLMVDNPFSAWAAKRGFNPEQGPDDELRAGARVTLEDLEKTHIKRLLDEVNNISEVARIVGIDRRTLQRKMLAWGFRDDA